MNKFTKLALAAMLAASAVTGVACSKEETKPAASGEAEVKEDATKINRAVFAAVLIAEEKFAAQFEKKTGLKDGKDVTYYAPAKEKDKLIEFLGAFWSKETATKEFDGVLADAAALAEINKDLEAKVNKDNEAVKDEAKKKKFAPLTVAADAKKFGVNAPTGAKFEDAKVEGKDGKYTVEIKGLKYSLEKSGTSYKVTSKEGTFKK